jgi:DNA replication protein DnaC
MSETERLRGQLKRLALPTIAQVFEEEAVKAAKTELSYTAFLARLVDDELAAKRDRSVSIRLSKAGFPVLRTLEDFDFRFQPALPAARIRELAELGFLGRAENVLFVGRPGVGKTHLATALAVRARLDLLVVDERGYLPMDSHRANLFFQLVRPRPTYSASA